MVTGLIRSGAALSISYLKAPKCAPSAAALRRKQTRINQHMKREKKKRRKEIELFK